MSGLLERLDRMKEVKRKAHDATIQIKIPIALRDRLFTQLKSDDLCVKDLMWAAIEEYLQSREQRT